VVGSRRSQFGKSRCNRAVHASAVVILLWGTVDDDPMTLVRSALARANASVFFLDHEKIFDSSIDCTIGDAGERCIVSVDEATLDLSNVAVAYGRRSNLHDYRAI